MGTADYCLVLVVIFFALLLWSLRQEEQRRLERRKVDLPPPDGVERRKHPERRGRGWFGSAVWALHRRWSRLFKNP